MATKITDRKGKKECIIFDLCADDGNTDQRTLSKIITSLYVKADRMEDAPSILNNDKVTLADHTAYRHIRTPDREGSGGRSALHGDHGADDDRENTDLFHGLHDHSG